MRLGGWCVGGALERAREGDEIVRGTESAVDAVEVLRPVAMVPDRASRRVTDALLGLFDYRRDPHTIKAHPLNVVKVVLNRALTTRQRRSAKIRGLARVREAGTFVVCVTQLTSRPPQ